MLQPRLKTNKMNLRILEMFYLGCHRMRKLLKMTDNKRIKRKQFGNLFGDFFQMAAMNKLPIIDNDLSTFEIFSFLMRF